MPKDVMAPAMVDAAGAPLGQIVVAAAQRFFAKTLPLYPRLPVPRRDCAEPGIPPTRASHRS